MKEIIPSQATSHQILQNMKRDRLFQKINGRRLALFAAMLLGVLAPASRAAESPTGQETKPVDSKQSTSEAKSIPFAGIGAKATADYHGNAMGIRTTKKGAQLHTAFQKLSGTVTREGLWLKSTDKQGGRLHLVACSIGRGEHSEALPATGKVSVGGTVVAFTRPRLTEEYSVSVDGVRQDFILTDRPAGTQDLQVELSLRGARAEESSAAGEGVRMVLKGSGRVLTYNRLRVVDATGRELESKLAVLSAERLVVRVKDASAAYPLRIDPTFSDANWSSLGSGMDSLVWALAVDGSGNVYAAGSFAMAGGASANHIAKWNGSAWSALGSGLNGLVYALAVDGSGNLYAGGDFTTAGGTSANHIAKWNGNAWTALGSGMNDQVYALVVDGSGNLYAGGWFTTAGGTSAKYIAKWNGSAWSALGWGMDRVVSALAVDGSGNVYAGGSFTIVGGLSANYIAKWNGSAWLALGLGMNHTVNALAVDGRGNVYAGGYFTTAGGTSASYIAKATNLNQPSLDFNADGKTDILWRNISTGRVYVWFMNGATFTSGADLGNPGDLNWEVVGTGDFNGDGKTGILWRNKSTGRLYVWFMKGTTFISGAEMGNAGDLNWEVVGTGDFNGDGKTDILWRNKATGRVYVWFMNGTTFTSGADMGNPGDLNWEVVGTGDFNGDGQTDILWRNKSTGRVYVWFMNGATFTSGAEMGNAGDLNWEIRNR